MFEYIKTMEKRLSEEDAAELKSIYEPKIVATPPGNARRQFAVMPDGEIRSYDDRSLDYIYSTDCGLSFKKKNGKPGSLGPSTHVPGMSRYVAIRESHAFYSDFGPDGDAVEVKYDVPDFRDSFNPYPVEMPNGKIRLITCSHETVDRVLNGVRQLYEIPALSISDDYGESWRILYLKTLEALPEAWPHLGVRWENFINENHITTLPDGRLMIVARTSRDKFYQYFSEDFGETWSDPAPSPFFGVNTTPYLLRLHDGRVVVFWNNTQPLPEEDKHRMNYPVDNGDVIGLAEDVFTNRDACHAAITEDGVNYIGFREVWLNDVRNSPDFRSCGAYEADKSVHQFEALELPFGKILVHFGQNSASRRLAIFDINWLYDTERTENFRNGLSHVSTQLYVKSCSGSIFGRYPGHCAWNRTNGALLVPDPSLNGAEVLQICRVHDERLFSEKQGLVWNFPASKSGEVSLEMMICQSGVAMSLCDHWFNPCDDTTPWYAIFATKLDKNTCPSGEWFTLTVRWDGDSADILINNEKYRTIVSHNKTDIGISYLHLITLSENEDFEGVLIRSMSKK